MKGFQSFSHFLSSSEQFVPLIRDILLFFERCFSQYHHLSELERGSLPMWVFEQIFCCPLYLKLGIVSKQAVFELRCNNIVTDFSRSSFVSYFILSPVYISLPDQLLPVHFRLFLVSRELLFYEWFWALH